MYRGRKRYADSSIGKKQSKSKNRSRSCEEKTYHKTETQAAKAAFAYKRRVAMRLSEIHPYKCGYCRGWHIGHDNRGLKRRKQQRMREDEAIILLLLSPASNTGTIRRRTRTLRHSEIELGVAA